MLKKFTKVGVFLVALVAMPSIASAETNFYINCAKSALEPGETTTCTYSAEGDPIDPAGITEMEIFIETNKNLRIESVDVDSAFENTSAEEPGIDEATISLESISPDGVTDDTFEILTVTVKLDEDATDECGAICIDTLSYVQGGEEFTSDTLVPNCKDLELGGENPPTGAFTSYLILGGGAVIAIGAMIALKDNKKFHNV